MAVLLGDTNGNRAVNATDVSQTKALSGQETTQENFRADINRSGSINATNLSIVKANAGSAVPTAPESTSRTAK